MVILGIMTSGFTFLGVDVYYQELIDFELIKMGAYTAAEMNPQLFPSAVTMPVLMFQVLEDAIYCLHSRKVQ
jgi:hypothetical protein